MWCILSCMWCIYCGVPQGSVLGPLLFLIYVNDIANLSPLGNIRLFADDTNVFVEHENLEQLYENSKIILEYLYKWFKANKSTVNSSKSSFTIFTFPKLISLRNIVQLHLDHMTAITFIPPYGQRPKWCGKKQLGRSRLQLYLILQMNRQTTISSS